MAPNVHANESGPTKDVRNIIGEYTSELVELNCRDEMLFSSALDKFSPIQNLSTEIVY